MEFKDKLIVARAKLNLSQEAMARALDVSFATINRWERGKTNPTKKTELRFNEFCINSGIKVE